MRERGDRTRNILEGEQTGLRKQTLHAEAAFAEVHSLDQFTKQLQVSSNLSNQEKWVEEEQTIKRISWSTLGLEFLLFLRKLHFFVTF